MPPLGIAAAGRAVVVLEKGPWAHEADFYKDERAMVARRAWKSGLVAEPRVLEDRNADGRLGFLEDTRRMNVALTRARRFLLVVGDSATLGGK